MVLHLWNDNILVADCYYLKVIHGNKRMIMIVYIQDIDFISIERGNGWEAQQKGKYNPTYNTNTV